MGPSTRNIQARGELDQKAVDLSFPQAVGPLDALSPLKDATADSDVSPAGLVDRREPDTSQRAVESDKMLVHAVQNETATKLPRQNGFGFEDEICTADINLVLVGRRMLNSYGVSVTNSAARATQWRWGGFYLPYLIAPLRVRKSPPRHLLL
jgi:hypothetical protein